MDTIYLVIEKWEVFNLEEMLKVANLSKRFKKKLALNKVDFSINKGEIVGLVGANGAGKTTIMKAILGLLNYDEGKITVNGQEVTATNHKALEKVGALIEYPGIYPYLTGYEHLKLFSEASDERAITEVVQDLKMTTYINKKAKGYSLGMKQKLGIALSILNKPELMILDEPMNGLDPQATRDVREVILKLSEQGTSFLISSHILSELEKIVGKVIIIDSGEITNQMSMDEMKHLSKQYLVVKTTNDVKAREILTGAAFALIESDHIKIEKVEESLLAEVVSLLSKQDIQIIDIQQEQNDLEASLLALLDTNGEGEE